MNKKQELILTKLVKLAASNTACHKEIAQVIVRGYASGCKGPELAKILKCSLRTVSYLKDAGRLVEAGVVSDLWWSKLGWTKISLLAKVVSTKTDFKAWSKFALESTVEQLKDAIYDSPAGWTMMYLRPSPKQRTVLNKAMVLAGAKTHSSSIGLSREEALEKIARLYLASKTCN